MRDSLVHTRLTIKNTGAGFNELLALFTKSGDENPTPFNSLIPMPSEILDTEATEFDDAMSEREIEELYFGAAMFDKNNYGNRILIPPSEISKYRSFDPNKENLYAKYGVRNWRQWSIKNWGTPWEADNINIKHHNKGEFLLSFTTEQSTYVMLGVIADRFPELTVAYDVYSYNKNSSRPRSGGFAPDLRFNINGGFEVSSQENGYSGLLLSDQFLEFCERFSRFPIGGTLLRRYYPLTRNCLQDQSSVTSNTEKK
jgi:hypothetical protein